MTSWAGRLLRPGHHSRRDERLDVLILCGAVLLLVATGIGLRDPWPADEPRFALIARDMLASGDWWFPRVGGDLYADKPPLFFWSIALLIALTGSLRVAFLLPSLLAAFGCVLLIYDLTRRLWNRETALLAGLTLLCTVQFVWQMRQAQIDAFLCLWTTLSLYALLRHLLLGPAWGWYAVGWIAAALGIVSKGVGFLPLLMLLPYACLRAERWAPRPAMNGGLRWGYGPLGFLIVLAVWLVPILLAAETDPALRAYRDEILFGQTVERYAQAWHHHQPFYYFLLEVIPGLWLPLSLCLPWLVRPWRAAWRAGDLRIVLPLIWVGMVVLFFSLSAGKRGVYVLPAVPALVLAIAPYMGELWRRPSLQRCAFAVVAAVILLLLGAAMYALWVPAQRQAIVTQYGLDPLPPLLMMAAVAALGSCVVGVRRGAVAFVILLVSVLSVVSFWINPALNEARSGRHFVAQVEAAAAGARELGLVAYKEQHLLYFSRPTYNFGHRRWREGDREVADAAAWLAAAPGRALLIPQAVSRQCFAPADLQRVIVANREEWMLTYGPAQPACIERGDASAVHRYDAH